MSRVILQPTNGLPPGDPSSPSTLDAVLRVWPAALCKKFGDLVQTWMFADDRASKAGSHLSAEDAPRAVQATVHTTTDLDRAIGLREHSDKRQIWQAGDQVAHSHDHQGRLAGAPGARSRGCAGR